MSRDYEREARQELEQGDAAKQWMKERVEVIHQRVTADDVLSRFGIRLRYNGQREEQFSCPFHGKDNKPSARFYPTSVRGPAHVWCFVCQKNWDCIRLWKEFAGFEGKFGALLREIERSYGITPPEAPRMAQEAKVDEAAEEVKRLFAVADSRLCNALPSFKQLDDMRGYLALGSVLDRLDYGLKEGTVEMAKAKELLRRVLDKIREREKYREGQCPDD